MNPSDQQGATPLSITESAGQYLAEMIEQPAGPKPADACVRVVSAESGGLRLALDQPTSGDCAFRHEDRVVLVAESSVAKRLSGMTLDLQINADGTKGLILLESPR